MSLIFWIHLKTRAIDAIKARPVAWIIGAGILLRLKHLLENRPFWLDEASYAISVTSRNYAEILSGREIIPEFSRAPMIFIMVEKFLVNVLGNNEMVLRIFPFFCGVVALLAFAVVAGKILSQRAFLIGLALFALAEPLVYYSAELKQYSTDLVCAIVLVGIASELLNRNFKTPLCLALAFIGAGILWASNAMVFVLAGIGVVILLNKPWAKGARVFILLCVTAVLWLISFLVLYKVSLHFMEGNKAITSTFKGALCTSPLFSMETIRWAWNVIVLSFPNPAGLKWWWLMLPCFIFGAWTLWRGNKNAVLLWLMPIVLTFIAALFGKYPFFERVILFLTAGYYVFIACAMDEILNRAQVFGKKWLVVILLGVFFLQPVADAAYYAVHSRSKTDNRGTMEFFAKNYKPGDFVYLSTLAQEPFWYYAAKAGVSKTFPQPPVGLSDTGLIYGFKIAKFALDPQEVNGRQFMFFRNEYNVFDDKGMFRAAMGSPKSHIITPVPLGTVFNYPSTGRTWLFVSGPSALETGVNALIVGSFDKRAKRLLSFEGLNAGVYLYDIQ